MNTLADYTMLRAEMDWRYGDSYRVHPVTEGTDAPMKLSRRIGRALARAGRTAPTC